MYMSFVQDHRGVNASGHLNTLRLFARSASLRRHEVIFDNNNNNRIIPWRRAVVAIMMESGAATRLQAQECTPSDLSHAV